MTDDARAEARALLTQAAIAEAARQAAIERGDLDAIREHERELSRLWRRYCDVEHETA